MKELRSAGRSMMKNYLGAAVLVSVAVLAEFTPLLHFNLGLDVLMHDEFFVIRLASIIFWLCIVAATARLLMIGIRKGPTRLR
jgi:hypothetical protein